LAIKSKGKGKRGGARLITYIKIIEHRIILLTIYDKTDKHTVTTNELIELIRNS
jgi:hypothetical protein